MVGRRQVLAGGSLLLAGLGGCAGAGPTPGSGDGPDPVPVETVEYEFTNQVPEPTTFHWGFEVDGEVQEWISQRVDTYEETGFALGRTDVSEAARLYVFVDGNLAQTDIWQFDRSYAVTVVYAVEDGSRELWTEATRYEN